jgi:hypothetical protein
MSFTIIGYIFYTHFLLICLWSHYFAQAAVLSQTAKATTEAVAFTVLSCLRSE